MKGVGGVIMKMFGGVIMKVREEGGGRVNSEGVWRWIWKKKE